MVGRGTAGSRSPAEHVAMLNRITRMKFVSCSHSCHCQPDSNAGLSPLAEGHWSMRALPCRVLHISTTPWIDEAASFCNGTGSPSCKHSAVGTPCNALCSVEARTYSLRHKQYTSRAGGKAGVVMYTDPNSQAIIASLDKDLVRSANKRQALSWAAWAAWVCLSWYADRRKMITATSDLMQQNVSTCATWVCSTCLCVFGARYSTGSNIFVSGYDYNIGRLSQSSMPFMLWEANFGFATRKTCEI